MPPAQGARRPRVVHGDDLLYEFFQHVLSQDDKAFEAVPQLLLETMGIWLPLDVYERWPVLLPYVVRDPDCRPKASVGRPDAWASPDRRGYLRDDNSLVKALPRALNVTGARTRRLSGARMGTEFVAAHVWRAVVGTDTLASRIPTLNSFVPNLVWLPGQIAKLTDREGGVVQQTLQAVAYSIYRNATVAPHLESVVEDCWSRLPPPTRVVGSVDLSRLNWFVSTPAFFAVRQMRLNAVLSGLRRLQAGLPLEAKVVASRYTQGLPHVSREAQQQLINALEVFSTTESSSLRAPT